MCHSLSLVLVLGQSIAFRSYSNGGYRLANDDTWRWSVDEQPIEYNQWRTGRAPPSWLMSEVDACIYMDPQTQRDDRWTWSPHRCYNYAFPFICE